MAEIEINAEFARALELIEAGERQLFITGKAGTGKSTLLALYRDRARDTPVILAPTGVAALNVGGQTVHRFFGFRIDATPEKIRQSRQKPRNARLYQRLSTVVIDEASMLRADLLDCIDQFLRKHGPEPGTPFGGVQMVYVGDLYQLPPVVTTSQKALFHTVYETPHFFGARALEGIEVKIIELQKVYRQKDADFVALLNRVRGATVTEADIERLNERLEPAFEPSKEMFCITLTGTNRAADQINERKLAALRGQQCVSEAEISGDFGKEHYPTATRLAFRKDAQIMLLNNDSAGRWVNGTIGSIESTEAWLDGAETVQVRLRDADQVVDVEPYGWEVVRFTLAGGAIQSETIGRFRQLPFRLAWAVTIHKSQGKTFDNVIIDLAGAFATGQTYVALSRCTSFEGIRLRRPITAQSIRVDWNVHKFFTGYRYREAEQEMSAADKETMIRSAIGAGAELFMTYLKPDDTESTRQVVPLSVGTETYSGKSFRGMRAYCTLRRAERMFRVDRILALQVQDQDSTA